MRRYPVLRVSRAPQIVSEATLDETATPKRIAMVASWTAATELTRSLSELVARLQECDYQVVVTIASDNPTPPRWVHGVDPATVVMMRPNVGYDFGTWAATLHRFPAIARADHVLQVNDSLVGPFTPLTDVVAHFEAAQTPVWGLVDSTQHYPHLQSFFVGYKGGVLTHPALRHFWRDVRVERDKWTLISRYEIGLTRLIDAVGLPYTVMYPWQEVVVNNQNPSVFGWRRLLDRGFPFVKREIITRPPADVRDADDAALEIQRRFGQAVDAWL